MEPNRSLPVQRSSRMASNTTSGVQETLQRAFQNIYDTMDEVDSFKLRALDSMKQTVTLLSDEVEKSKGYIARAEGQAQAQKQVAESSLLSIEG